VKEYKYHPLADLFPLLDKDDLADLVKDIKDNGQIEPITLYQGEILDGRNRYRACQQLGIEPKITIYEGTTPFEYVISKNLHRRHLTTSQRAMIAAEIANMRHGGDRVSEQARNSALGTVTQAQAAHTLNVSVDSVKEAVRLRRDASRHPDILRAVIDGKVTLNAARKAISPELEPQQEQPELTKPQSKPQEHPHPKPSVRWEYFIAIRNHDPFIVKLQKMRIDLIKRSYEAGYIRLSFDQAGSIASITEVPGTGIEVEDYNARMEIIHEMLRDREAELMDKHGVELTWSSGDFRSDWFFLMWKGDYNEIDEAMGMRTIW
jgi:ParB-like nuclease domain